MTDLPSENRDPVVDMAIAIGGEDTLDELLGAILLATRGRDKLKPDVVVEFTDGSVSRNLVELVFSRLEADGVVTASQVDDSLAYRFDNAELIDAASTAREIILARKYLTYGSQEPDVEFVCTLPTNDPAFSSMDPVDFGFGQITSRLLSLCGRAKESLVLFGPFLESGGIEWLLPGLKGAIRSGVEVKVVSRELNPPGGKFAALDSLVTVNEEYDGALEIYDYFEQPGDREWPLYTLHSKLVVVDGGAAYIGSANFTTYGFDEYFEVGVIVQGDIVADLDGLCSYLVTHAADRVY